RAQDVVNGSVAYWIQAVIAFQDLFFMDFRVVVDIQPDNIAPVGHEIEYSFIAQIEDPVHDLVFNFIDGARTNAFLHQRFDLFFGNLTFARSQVEQAHNPVGGGAQEPDKGCCDPAEESHGPGNGHGELFGDDQSHPLGNQLPENRCEKGNDDDNHYDGNALAVGGHRRNPGQKLFEKGGESRPAVQTGKNADQGDPYLNGGQELIGRSVKLKRFAGRPVPFLYMQFQPGLPAGHKGYFRGGENSVEQDEKQYDEYFRKH